MNAGRFFAALICVLLLLVAVAAIFFSCTPTGKSLWNQYNYTMQKVDDATLYETRKNVEDTCRAMIATYERNKVEFTNAMAMYENAEDEDTKNFYLSSANGYREQANSTASTYNNYILKNSYVWEDNVPDDIYMTLAYLTVDSGN